MGKCDSPRGADDEVLIEVILYALLGLNSPAAGRGSPLQDTYRLQADLLSFLRDLLLERGTPLPAGFERLVSSTNRLHLRRQRRLQRQAQRQQLLQEAIDENGHARGRGSSDLPHVSNGLTPSTTNPSNSNTTLSLQSSTHDSQQIQDAHHHLDRLMGVTATQGLDVTHLPAYHHHQRHHQVSGYTSLSFQAACVSVCLSK